MKICVTGSPGTGKTTIASELAKQLKLKVINEKDFALKNSIGKFNEDNELEIPVEEFEKKANTFLKENDDVVFEGHVLCEMKLKVDRAILLKLDPEILEIRLEKRNYSPEKKLDNVFCEGIDYCKKHLQRNYSKEKIIEIETKGEIQRTIGFIIQKVGINKS
jgi:adenylate kinase